MDRDELSTALQAARAKLDAALGALNESQLLAPGPDGPWSAKDVIAHVTAWDVDLLTNLGKVNRGQKPGKTDWSAASIQAQNDLWHAELKDRPPERVLADYIGVHQQLLRQVADLTDAELAAPAGWLQGRPLYQYFVDHVVNHESEHAGELAAWLAHRSR
jgi:uncharacterized damage-inducible protein DinB